MQRTHLKRHKKDVANVTLWPSFRRTYLKPVNHNPDKPGPLELITRINQESTEEQISKGKRKPKYRKAA